MIDIILIAVMGLVVWMVGNDGPWSAAITFVSVLLSGLIAMNFYEPLANLIGTIALTSYDWQVRLDIITFLGLFSACVFGFKTIGEALLPTYADLDGLVFQASRWGFAALTGYLVMAIVCTSLHMAPLPREFLGFAAERGNLLGTAPDRQWLALTQYVSEHSLRRLRPDGRPVIFDGAVFPANPDDARTMQVWSDFPIRYATRRQQYASGGGAASSSVAPAPPPPAPVRRNDPTAGTGGF